MSLSHLPPRKPEPITPNNPNKSATMRITDLQLHPPPFKRSSEDSSRNRLRHWSNDESSGREDYELAAGLRLPRPVRPA